jgi:hypothetical protein
VGGGRLAGGPAQSGAQTQREKKGERRRGRRWDPIEVGPTCSEKRERALTGGPLGLTKFDLFQTNSTHSNLIWSKQDPPVLQKFEIKYG